MTTAMHRYRISQSLLARSGEKGMRTCSIEGCDWRHKAHGWCNVHYMRYTRTGQFERVDPATHYIHPKRPPAEVQTPDGPMPYSEALQRRRERIVIRERQRTERDEFFFLFGEQGEYVGRREVVA